ncbi:hypothetical protein PV08_02835 [Exophiala spinifera]|uniref:Uncharacterized protein n=1 Tax=Exophiala spinifera TaxID=91928 RepID=A0A0D2A0R6_9EURO|nr:uncharacterized protein PV08_02835 [Exophiala spinifera]KIW18547.1 hypothetical protein PV08_02835 [Exophiala spinifera]
MNENATIDSEDCQRRPQPAPGNNSNISQQSSPFLAAFNRASMAVMQTLDWPENEFLQWAKTDVNEAVAAAEEDIASLDYICQQSMTPEVLPSTLEAAPSMENGLSIFVQPK